MTTFKKRIVEQVLRNKGTNEAHFHEERRKDHIFFYFIVDGADTGIWTKVSHGPGKGQISDNLLHKMARRQLQINYRDFIGYITCANDCGDIAEILRRNGTI